jgi:transposase
MAQVNRIRELFFEKGLKYAEISRVTGFDVKTVKKYIYQEDFNPMPKVQKPRPSKLEPYKKDIDAWLEEDKQYRKKQRHTARRIFDRLAEKYPAFDCSYRLVASYVAEKKLELYGESRFYMPLRHIPGEARWILAQPSFMKGAPGIKVIT